MLQLDLDIKILNIIIFIVIIAITFSFAKFFDISDYKTILILFVFIVTLFYTFDILDVWYAIISYFIFAVYIYMSIQKSKESDIE